MNAVSTSVPQKRETMMDPKKAKQQLTEAERLFENGQASYRQVVTAQKRLYYAVKLAKGTTTK